jgi:lipopolysaccharide export system permease protein
VGKEVITSAQSGKVQWQDGGKFLVLENGQRIEKHPDNKEVRISTFARYSTRIGADNQSQRSYVPAASISTQDLIRNPTPVHMGELSWRAGVTLAAFNLIIVGIAMAGVNPRVGRSGNLGLAFLGFVVYLNMLIMGKSWISSAQVGFWQYMALLHGGVLLCAAGWLAVRHNAWTWKSLAR